MKKFSKQERQKKLGNIIDENPFLTDRELAEKLNVSVQTIRLDRLELNIPEVRKRTRQLAHNAYDNLKSVTEGEVIGELIKLELNNYAESFLHTTQEMALKKSNIIRGHHIFAQANSLAVAVINAELVLTGSVELKYIKPVNVGDSLLAQARVESIDDSKHFVRVETKRNEDIVFNGSFTMFPRKGRDYND
ncbi:MAG: transcription factor FapR [Halanaerobiales bacterium]